MSEPKQLCSILSVEKIAAYLNVAPGKVRTALANLADGGYAIEVRPGKWIRVISVPVEILDVASARIAAIRYTPPPPQPFSYASARDAAHDAAMARIDREMAEDARTKTAKAAAAGKPVVDPDARGADLCDDPF